MSRRKRNVPPVVPEKCIPFSLFEPASVDGSYSVEIIDAYFIGCYKNYRTMFEMGGVKSTVFLAAETDLENPEVGERC